MLAWLNPLCAANDFRVSATDADSAVGREYSAENAKLNTFSPQRHKERKGIQKQLNRRDVKFKIARFSKSSEIARNYSMSLYKADRRLRIHRSINRNGSGYNLVTLWEASC